VSTGNRTLRRQFLISTALAFPAAALGGSLLGMSAAEAASIAAPALADYEPVFFSRSEWEFVTAACDRLIPADAEGPGALDSNVPVFIDQELKGAYGTADDWYMEGPHDPKAAAAMGYQLPYTPQELYRRGIAATQAWCRQKHGMGFEALDAMVRDDVLTRMQKNEIEFEQFGEATLTAAVFFGFLLTNTKEGYLSDPIYGGNKGMEAWKMINFPGARASFLEWVGQHNVRYPLGPVGLKGERG
jgi:gluconate 2-dehydrogenase gamma chain